MNYTKELNNFISEMQRYTLKLTVAANGMLCFTLKPMTDVEAYADVLTAIRDIKQQSKISRFISNSSSSVVVDMVKLKFEQLQEYFEPRLTYEELKEIILFLLGQGFTKERLQSEIGINKVMWSRIFRGNNVKPEAMEESNSNDTVKQQPIRKEVNTSIVT